MEMLYYIDVSQLLMNLSFSRINKINSVNHSLSGKIMNEVFQLHDNLCHAASPTVMSSALKNGAWTDVSISADQVSEAFSRKDCISCSVGKINRFPRNVGSGLHPSVFGEYWSVDFQPVTPASVTNHIGFYLFVELLTGYLMSFLVKKNNQVVFLMSVRMVSAYLKKNSHQMRFLRVDAGAVENATEVQLEISELLGVTIDSAAPECQFQNPVERHIQTLMKGISSMFARQNYLGKEFWGLAVLMFINSRNVCPNKLSGIYSPYYFMTGKHPNIHRRFKFYFGEPVISVILRAQESSFTFSSRGELGYVVGSLGSLNGATLLYIPSKSNTPLYQRLDVRRIKIEEIKSNQVTPYENSDGEIVICSKEVDQVRSFPIDFSISASVPDIHDVQTSFEELNHSEFSLVLHEDDISLTPTSLEAIEPNQWSVFTMKNLLLKVMVSRFRRVFRIMCVLTNLRAISKIMSLRVLQLFQNQIPVILITRL